MGYYKAVVESGACSYDYKRYEEICDCGHKHRSYETAEKCLIRLIGYNRKTRTCSAMWYNGRIHDQDGRRVYFNCV